MILALHGFGADESQYSFLGHLNYRAPKFDELVGLEWKNLKQNLMENISKDTILIGYSFGARIAARLFSEEPTYFDKLIMLAGHLGIESKSELQTRSKIEKEFISKLEGQSHEEFEDYWNSLSLFKSDQDVKITCKDKTVLKNYFLNYGLTKQPYLKEKLLTHKERIQLFYGEQDYKYLQYSRDELSDFNVKVIKGCGHRLLQNQEVKKEIFKIL